MRTQLQVAKGPVKRTAAADISLNRATLSSTQLYQLAAQEEVDLNQDERDRLSSDYLFVLALTNRLELNQRDKDRLRPVHLAHLAVTFYPTV
jgi:hypothetical protein